MRRVRGHGGVYSGGGGRGGGRGRFNKEEETNWRDRRPNYQTGQSWRGIETNYRKEAYQDKDGGQGTVSQGQGQDSLGKDNIVGNCMEMCPRSELVLREREGLLHPFEILEEMEAESQSPRTNNDGVGIGRTRKPLPKADLGKTIKSFARSAAGQDKTISEDLRPAQVLRKTVNYLNERILPKTDCPFNVIYDFMFDRLRAVRQDLVIQRIENEDAINILESIVMFHVYSGFRLRNEDISIYDPHINDKHLVDCLRRLLYLYEYNNYMKSSRADFEALNLLVHIEAYDVISRGFSIRRDINSIVFQTTLRISLAYQSHNFIRFCKLLLTLPSLLQMYCVRYIQTLRGWALGSLCVTFGVNTCKLPLSWITKLLFYPSESSLHIDLGKLDVEIFRDDANRKYAKFQKTKVDVIQARESQITSDYCCSAIPQPLEDVLSLLFSHLKL